MQRIITFIFIAIGQIELFYDRGNHHEFLSQLKELARHGDLIKNTSYPFEFSNVEKPYEVYTGSNVRLRYYSDGGDVDDEGVILNFIIDISYVLQLFVA